MSESVSLKRRPDWPERFIAFVESRRHTPFAWGSNDCALFAADGIEAMTGVDLAKEWRGYKSERGALSRIKKAGGMRAFASGLSEKHVGLVQRGDVVLALIEGRETFGLALGNGFYCAPGPEGLAFRPMSEAIAVFAV